MFECGYVRCVDVVVGGSGVGWKRVVKDGRRECTLREKYLLFVDEFEETD